MPRKIRQLKEDLRRAGYRELTGRGKGSHSIWGHTLVPMVVTLAGQDGDDALPYQEKLVRQAVNDVRAFEGE